MHMSYRMADRQDIYPNVHQMVDTNGYNVIDRLAIVGVSTRILVKIYRAHPLKTDGQIVQATRVAR